MAKGRRASRRDEAEISIRENGMPSLRDGFMNQNGAPRYADLLDPPYGDTAAQARGRYPPEDYPALQAFTDYAASDEIRAAGLTPPIKSSIAQIDLRLRVEAAVDHHLQRFGDSPSSAHTRAIVLGPIRRALFAPYLGVAVVVPIAMTRFEVPRFRLGPNAYVLKMGDRLQRARWSNKAYAGGAHEAVVGAATHALVLTGWTVENANFLEIGQRLSLPVQETADATDLFFSVLRLETGIATGYAQELRLARGWRTYRLDWPEVIAIGMRRYPEWMDHFGWTVDETPLVTRQQLEATCRTYRAIETLDQSRLRLALRRLNAAMTRDSPSDAVLDATIALEILLGDKNTEAISWKLRMRAAALAGLYGNHDAALAVERDLQKIYKIRSAIVHGGSTKDAEQAPEGARITIAQLRSLLRLLIAHPKYFDPLEIDRNLMLGPPRVDRLPP